MTRSTRTEREPYFVESDYILCLHPSVPSLARGQKNGQATIQEENFLEQFQHSRPTFTGYCYIAKMFLVDVSSGWVLFLLGLWSSHPLECLLLTEETPTMPALKNGKIIKTFILKYVLAVNSQRTCYDFLQFLPAAKPRRSMDDKPPMYVRII